MKTRIYATPAVKGLMLTFGCCFTDVALIDVVLSSTVSAIHFSGGCGRQVCFFTFIFQAPNKIISQLVIINRMSHNLNRCYCGDLFQCGHIADGHNFPLIIYIIYNYGDLVNQF